MIPLFKVFMAPSAAEEVTKVLNSGYIGEGPKVKEFEESLRTFLRTDRVIATNSATSAEHLALLLLKRPGERDYNEYGTVESRWPGLQPGDTVACSPLTCFASNAPVYLAGYKIKWIDIDPKTLNMDLDDLARKLTPEVKVVMLPFWGGMPVDMDRLKEVQTQAYMINGMKPAIIIDGAHSLGTTYRGRHICSFDHITTYSFQAIKHVTAVDGGALVVPHNSLFTRGKLLRWYGIDRSGTRNDFRCEENIFEVGTKWHMNDVSATIGIENMKHVDKILGDHRANALYYNSILRGSLPPSVASGITLLEETKHATSAYWIYSILVEDRPAFMKHMSSHGITTSRVHERNDKHSCFAQFRSQLPNLESVIDKMICIPVGPWVSPQDLEMIVDTIKKGW